MGKSAKKVHFEDFVEQSSKALTPDDLFKQLMQAVAAYGYDRVIFSVTHDGDLPEDKNKLGIFSNYASDWQKFYQEKRYDLIDPVLKCAATYNRAFYWAELEEKLKLSTKQHRFFREGEEAGLWNGVGVPMRGTRGQLSGVALASSENVKTYKNLDLLTAFCNQFYAAYKRFYTPLQVEEAKKLITLTEKEAEILKWLIASKTDEEISMIMSISKHTVDTHVRNIYRKMGVNNRVQASVAGIFLGLGTF